MKSATEVLIAARALLGKNGERWIKGEGGQDPFYCCLTALIATPPGEYVQARDTFAKSIGASDTRGIPRWNDSPERTFADVAAAFERAIVSADTAERAAPGKAAP